MFPLDPVLMGPLFKAILWSVTTVNNQNQLDKQIFFPQYLKFEVFTPSVLVVFKTVISAIS